MWGDKAFLQAALQFLLKVLDGVVIRSLCRQVRFFNQEYMKACLVIYCVFTRYQFSKM